MLFAPFCKMRPKRGNKSVWGFRRSTALTVFVKRLKRQEGESNIEFLARGRTEFAALSPLEKGKLAAEAAAPAIPKTSSEKQSFMVHLCRQLNKVEAFVKQMGGRCFFEIYLEDCHYVVSHNARREEQATTVRSKSTDVRSSVQQIFNRAYGRALGKEREVAFPYKKHSLAPVVEITGMPEGVEFKNPCTIGVPKLEKIFANKAKIKMTLLSPSADEGQPQDLAEEIVAEELPSSAVEHPVADGGQPQDLAKEIVAKELPSSAVEHPVADGGQPQDLAKEIVAEELPSSAVEHPVQPQLAPTNLVNLSAVTNLAKHHQNQQSGGKRGGKGSRTLWTAAEVLAVQQYFSQELAGLKPVTRSNIDSFLAQQTAVKRTSFALGNYLLRNRKKSRPNNQ